jgi:hypothetical protein
MVARSQSIQNFCHRNKFRFSVSLEQHQGVFMKNRSLIFVLCVWSVSLLGCSNLSNSSLSIQGATLSYTSAVTTIEAKQVGDFLVTKQFFGSSDTGGAGRLLKLQKIDGRLQLAMGFDEATLQNAISKDITKLEFAAIAKVMGEDLKQPVSVLACNNSLSSCQEFMVL